MATDEEPIPTENATHESPPLETTSNAPPQNHYNFLRLRIIQLIFPFLFLFMHYDIVLPTLILFHILALIATARKFSALTILVLDILGAALWTFELSIFIFGAMMDCGHGFAHCDFTDELVVSLRTAMAGLPWGLQLYALKHSWYDFHWPRD